MGVFTTISNVSSLRDLSALAVASRQMNTAMERLSTGKKINRAADDPAGMQVVEQFKARLASIHKRLEGIAYNEQYMGARDGAEAGLGDLLLQLRGDVTLASNKGAMTHDEREAIQTDAVGVIKAINYLTQTTTFNGEQIIAGYSSATLGLGGAVKPGKGDGRAPDQYSLEDLLGAGGLNLVDGDLDSAQKVVEAAIGTISGDRAAIGNQIKESETERQGLMSELENTEAARSGIEDADFAEETSRLMRAEVLKQASLYVTQLSQSQQSDTVLELLKGSLKQR